MGRVLLFRSYRIPLLSILALMIVLAACSGNPSSSLSNNDKKSTSHKLVVYVLGLGEKLSQSDTLQNSGYGYASSFYSPGDIQPYLQGTNDFKSAQSLVFSYRGFTSDGKPSHFFCWDTFNNQLAYDVSLLNLQIIQYLKVHPNTDVYIVSHSLGGVIAFGYMAQLIETTHSNAISDLGTRLGTLKGIAILDSPLGGVTNMGWYNLATIVKMLLCDPQLATNEIIHEFQGALFQRASSPALQGVTASILNSLGSNNTSNQKVASDAAHLGIAILIVGNENDLLWRPNVCGIGPDFVSTEYLQELGRQSNGGALYSRFFMSGQLSCNALFSNVANHVDVLHLMAVEKAIWETFTGNPVDQLTPVMNMPVVPTPTPTLLYSADWSKGLNGWMASPEWSVANGQLQSDGTDGNGHLGLDAISPPYRPSIANYAVEARIQIVNSSYGLGQCYVGIRGRVQNPSSSPSYVGDGYFLGFNGGYSAAMIAFESLNNTLNGGFDVLQSQNFNPSFGWHTYRAEFRGKQITLLIDGKSIAQVTDSRLPTTAMLQLEDGLCPANVSSFQVLAL